jgi:hypothetical protein
LLIPPNMLKLRLMALGILGLLILSMIATIPVSDVPVKAQGGSGTGTRVGVGLYLISFGNYDENKGAYTMDFYIWFQFPTNGTPAGFSIDNFEFMNGRAGSRDQISFTDDGTTTEIWYRVQADLYATPHFKMYPFDKQKLTMELEDSGMTTTDLVYYPLTQDNTLDPDLTIAGWDISGSSWTATTHHYGWGEEYSRMVFTINVSRPPTSTTIKTMLPPIIFCIVSGLSFFFPSTRMGEKVGLSTSMLITAVMFHISQTSSLPPLGSLIMIDKIMLATYTFLTISLIATSLVVINEDIWKKEKLTMKINVIGGMMAAIMPFLMFGILWFT